MKDSLMKINGVEEVYIYLLMVMYALIHKTNSF
jgi:hypothetical protein